jgi:hypothetical protein
MRLKFIFSIVFALVFATIGAGVVAPILDVKPIFPFMVFLAGNFIPLPGNALFELAFTHPGGIGVTAQFNLPYLPSVLRWNDAAAPITLLHVGTKQDGILHDLNAAAIAAMRGYKHVGALAANDQMQMLASGHLDRDTTLRVTSAAAGAINFYASSSQKATADKPVIPYRSQIDTALAGTATVFQNFTALFVPTMATLTDYADVEFADGHIQRMEIEDLQIWSTLYQDAPGIIIDNSDSMIHKVSLRCALLTPVYVLRVYLKGQ